MVPSRAYGLESFRDHGCRCHEPSDDGLCVIKCASQDRSASTTILAGGALRYQETAALTSSLQETAALPSSLQETAALPSSPQPRSCVNKAPRRDICETKSLRRDICDTKSLRRDICDTKSLRRDICDNKSLRRDICDTKSLRRDICDNKASSDVQAPLRGVRDQYSSVPRVFGEAKTCATSSSSVHCSEGSSLDT
ncbi:hypothetical protein N7530_008925 [Penicillium desertorum]|uniref:Uncharacterized protein n=1 Tax=Penicillium desertorum TaxID=1303715 RepID=A0A9W9WQ48_9EURO|nr:hypothetical protein N7530_008925 [Penicillium desertorum]